MCKILCIRIIGAGFSSGAGKFVEDHAAAQISNVFLVKAGGIAGIICAAHIRGKHAGCCQASSYLQLRILPGKVHNLCNCIFKELGLHTGSSHASDLFLIYQKTAGAALAVL